MTTPSKADTETIGISDDLTPYVKRINAAVGYTGDADHEDVISILRQFRTTTLTQEREALLAKLPPKFEDMGIGDTEYAARFTHNEVIDQVTAIIKGDTK